MQDITFLGETDFRRIHKSFGIRTADRRTHLYVIGKTGTGKSTLLESMILQDMQAGRGFALLDPHGDLAAPLSCRVPAHRKSDLIHWTVPDDRSGMGFNPLDRHRRRAMQRFPPLPVAVEGEDADAAVSPTRAATAIQRHLALMAISSTAITEYPSRGCSRPVLRL